MNLRGQLEPVQRTEEYKEGLKSKIEEIERLLETNQAADEAIDAFNNLTGRSYDDDYFRHYWRSISIQEFVDEACNPYPVKVSDIQTNELIELVRRIQDVDTYGSDTRFYLEVLMANTNMPGVSDLIFYEDLTPAEIVEEILRYKPIVL
ncbi:hypothetical protein WMW72_07265 [Paenibacillus filicis]|uniref:Uncharacterized protein n=1 Tax=Paenibacillus filicis TaxID=669464 RepID=A0ABU9DFR9_9BACL